jgi:uncharacterized protein
MKRIQCFFPFLFAAILTYGQGNKQIVIGVRDTIFSKVLDEKRTLLVHLPLTEPDVFAPGQKYPVVYVLEGESLFYSVVAISEQLSGGSGNYMYPKMIVVGIMNTDRTRDLTPTHSTNSTVMPSFLLSNSGGGEKFLSFFRNELIPHIDSTYAAAPFRVIIGHSFGGLTAIHALMKHQGLFNSVVAIDPSMWWDNQKFLEASKAALLKNSYAGYSLFMAIANSMSKNLTLQTAPKTKRRAALPSVPYWILTAL